MFGQPYPQFAAQTRRASYGIGGQRAGASRGQQRRSSRESGRYPVRQPVPALQQWSQGRYSTCNDIETPQMCDEAKMAGLCKKWTDRTTIDWSSGAQSARSGFCSNLPRFNVAPAAAGGYGAYGAYGAMAGMGGMGVAPRPFGGIPGSARPFGMGAVAGRPLAGAALGAGLGGAAAARAAPAVRFAQEPQYQYEYPAESEYYGGAAEQYPAEAGFYPEEMGFEAEPEPMEFEPEIAGVPAGQRGLLSPQGLPIPAPRRASATRAGTATLRPPTFVGGAEPAVARYYRTRA